MANIFDFSGNYNELREKLEKGEAKIVNGQIIEESEENEEKGGIEQQTKEQKNDQQDSKKDDKEEKKKEDDYKFDTDYIKPKEYKEVKTYVENAIPVLLIGHAGTGKTEMARNIAKELNLDFYSDSSVTDIYKITGYKDANGVFNETEFFKAFTKGGVYLLDEIDASYPEVLVALNSAFANGFFTFAGVKYTKHKEFRLIATANTFGNGANTQYVGRYQLDKATLDRFIFITINYDSKVEEKICSDEIILNCYRQLRKSALKNRINHIFSYRGLIYLNKMLSTKLPINVLIRQCVLKDLKNADLKIMLNDFPIDLTANDFYRALEKEIKNEIYN